MARHVRRKLSPEQTAQHKARQRYWSWREMYFKAIEQLTLSLSTGRRITPAQIVKYATELADAGVTIDEKRKPSDYDD